jgi:hypothetical protein
MHLGIKNHMSLEEGLANVQARNILSWSFAFAIVIVIDLRSFHL